MALLVVAACGSSGPTDDAGGRSQKAAQRGPSSGDRACIAAWNKSPQETMTLAAHMNGGWNLLAVNVGRASDFESKCLVTVIYKFSHDSGGNPVELPPLGAQYEREVELDPMYSPSWSNVASDVPIGEVPDSVQHSNATADAEGNLHPGANQRSAGHGTDPKKAAPAVGEDPVPVQPDSPPNEPPSGSGIPAEGEPGNPAECGQVNDELVQATNTSCKQALALAAEVTDTAACAPPAEGDESSCQVRSIYCGLSANADPANPWSVTCTASPDVYDAPDNVARVTFYVPAVD